MKPILNAKEEKVIVLLESTQSEMEELRSNLNQEKNETELQYESLKGQLKVSIREMKSLLESNTPLGEELTNALNSKLTELERQLQLPKPSVVDDLKMHLSNIKNALAEIASRLDKGSPLHQTLEHIHDNLHRYKIKFEILKLKFALGKMDIKDMAGDVRNKATRKIIALRKFIHANEEVAKKNWKNFRHEVNEAYSDIHKTLTLK